MTGGDNGAARPLTFVACVSNEEIVRANLLSSPCLRAGSRHEVLLMRGCPSAAQGLNEGLRQAKNDVVVCLHQDVYLPEGWDERFRKQYELARMRFGEVGVVGVYGIRRLGALLARAGHVFDRDHALKEAEPLPAAVETLDELLLAVPRGVPLEFDPALGFHFYGADICLSALARGLRAVAIDALCFHNSVHVGVSPQFFESARVFAGKWRHRPIVTPCAVIDVQGNLSVA